MITADFVTAGNATFTIEPTTGYVEAQAGKGVEVKPWYTYRVRHKEASEKDGRKYNEAWFVSLLTGPENTTDFSYLGMLNPETGRVAITRASCAGEEAQCVVILRRVLAALWEGRGEAIEAAGWKVHHEGKCGRCGRKLTVPASIESGIGPECAAQMGLG